MDIGSAVGRASGISEEQLHDLQVYRESAAFTQTERLAIDLAVEMARTPVDIPPELDEALARAFDQRQLVELAAAIAWENYRARFNRVFHIDAAGYSTGAFCVLPEAPNPA